MRCGKCNKRIRRTDAYCPYCSKKVSERERKAAGPTVKERLVEKMNGLSLPALPRVPTGWALWAGGLVFLGLVLWGLSGSHNGVDQSDLAAARGKAYKKGRHDGYRSGFHAGVDHVINGEDIFEPNKPYVITFFSDPLGSQMRTYLPLDVGETVSCDSSGDCTSY